MVKSKDIVIEVYDQDLNEVSQISAFNSMTWTSAFQGVGGFEIAIPYQPQLDDVCQVNNLIMRNDVDQVMVITKVQYMCESEGGRQVVISGQDVILLLSRRIIWETIVFSGDPVNYIKRIINDNVISPTTANRPMPLFHAVTGSAIGKTVHAQATYANVLTKVLAICKNHGLGIRSAITADRTGIDIQIYKQRSRTTYQTTYTPLIFSDTMGNIAAWSYSQDYTDYKNLAKIAGEGSGKSRKTATIGGGVSGLGRYELYVDARDLSTNEGDEPIGDITYTEMLQTRGEEALAESPVAYELYVEARNTNAYRYPGDYQLGDIASIDCGPFAGDAFVSEITETFDGNGHVVFPTLELASEVFILATEDGYDIITEDEYEIIV